MATDIEHVVKDINDLVVGELQQAYPDSGKASALADTLFHITETTGKHVEIDPKFGLVAETDVELG